MKILGLSSDGLLGYEAPRSGAFRKSFGPGGTLFGRRDLPVSPQGDTPPQMCFEGGDGNTHTQSPPRDHERCAELRRSSSQDYQGPGTVNDGN